ncbi:MAG: hypothetical protein WCV83_02320 [Candidatus Magasanikbacteria bacterium]
MSVPIINSFQAENSVNLTTATITQSIHRAILLSQGLMFDSAWGVNLTTGKITIFKGTSFAARDISFDEYYETPANITIAGLTEITFAPLTGQPQNIGTITITAPDNDPREININARGMVDY